MSEFGPIFCVPPDSIDAAWPLVVSYLEKAYAACDEFMPENLKDWLKEERGLLWIYTKGGIVFAAMVTSLEKRPSGLICRIGATGSMNLLMLRECEARIVEYARAEGCVKIVLEGRPGWSRVLPAATTERIILEKVL